MSRGTGSRKGQTYEFAMAHDTSSHRTFGRMTRVGSVQLPLNKRTAHGWNWECWLPGRGMEKTIN